MHAGIEDIAIKERAYAIWEEDGRPDGRDWEHWYRALKEIAAPAPAKNGGVQTRSRTARTRGRLRGMLKSALS